MVAHITYVVDRRETHWTIAGCDDCGSGWFPTRKEALKSALWDAARVRPPIRGLAGQGLHAISWVCAGNLIVAVAVHRPPLMAELGAPEELSHRDGDLPPHARQEHTF